MTIWVGLGGRKLVIERDSTNVIKWVKGLKRPPWRLSTTVREIRALVRGVEVSFVHIRHMANGVAIFFLQKNGLEGPIFGVFHL